MSTLTVEERSLLKALGCRDKAQVLALFYKLKKLDVDYELEMAGESIADNNI